MDETGLYPCTNTFQPVLQHGHQNNGGDSNVSHLVLQLVQGYNPVSVHLWPWPLVLFGPLPSPLLYAVIWWYSPSQEVCNTSGAWAIGLVRVRNHYAFCKSTKSLCTWVLCYLAFSPSCLAQNQYHSNTLSSLAETTLWVRYCFLHNTLLPVPDDSCKNFPHHIQ